MKKQHSQLGMTLMEILISVFLLGMMGLVTSGVVMRAHDTKTMLMDVNDRYHGVRVVLDRMTRELSMAFITPNRPFGDQSKQPKTLFQGKEESSINRLTFTSFSHVRIVRNSKESDQNVLTYYGKPHPTKAGVSRLFRSVKPRLDSYPEKKGSSSELLENVVSLQIRYWDKRKKDWVNDWDTSKIERRGFLPPLVEIKLTIKDLDDKDLTFMTRTRIFMNEAIKR